MARNQECQDLMTKWCKWLISLIFFVAYFLATSLVSRNRPVFYIDDFYVSSLNKTRIHSTTNDTTTTNTTSAAATTVIYFDLRIQNKNSLVGVYYDNPLNLTFTYFLPNYATTASVAIGEYAIPGFYQGNGKVKHVRDFVVVWDLFSAVDEHRREMAETYVSLMGPAKVVVFGVNLDGKVKFKSIENKKSDLKAGGVVEVNGDTGNVVKKKTMELKYDSGSDKWGAVQWLLFFPLLLLFALLGMGCIYLPLCMSV